MVPIKAHLIARSGLYSNKSPGCYTVKMGEELEWMLRKSQNAHYKDSEVVQQKHLPSELTLPSNLHMLNWLLYKVNEMSHTFPSLDPALPAPSS